MELNKSEKTKYEIIQKVVNNEISKKEAKEILKISRQHINRLIKVYAEYGEEGFIHKNRGKANKNKKDPNLINEVKELYLTEYFDYNFEAFYEVIEKKYNISYSVMCKAFLNDDIISPIAHKKTTKFTALYLEYIYIIDTCTVVFPLRYQPAGVCLQSKQTAYFIKIAVGRLLNL